MAERKVIDFVEKDRFDRESHHEYYIEDGVVRWASNNAVPFEDMLQKMLNAGHITPVIMHKSITAREVETTAVLTEYREMMKNHVPSGEELYELRAAFREGTTVVNVVTGKRTQL